MMRGSVKRRQTLVVEAVAGSTARLAIQGRAATNSSTVAAFSLARLISAGSPPMDCAQLAYEMVIQSGAYFAANGLAGAGRQIVKEIVIRFAMPDPEGSYHIPLMIAPHSYSVWWSA